MKRCLYFVLLIFPILTLTIMQTRAEGDFIENFDGTSLDPAKWNVLQSSTLSGNPAYGSSIKVSGGYLDLSSDGPGFPFIYTATNPFPTSGNFEFEIAMQFPTIADYGCGVEISNAGSSLNTNWQKYALISIIAGDIGNVEPIRDNQMNAIAVNFVGSQPYQIKVPGFKPSTPEHIYRVTYINGTYTLYVDGQSVIQEASFERPNTIVLGCEPNGGVPPSPESWAHWSYWGWSSVKINYVKVTRPGVNLMNLDLGSVPVSTIILVTVVLLLGIGLGYFFSIKRRKN